MDKFVFHERGEPETPCHAVVYYIAMAAAISLPAIVYFLLEELK